MGDVDFTTWTTAVYRMGGVPTTWPPQAGQGHVGEPAAQFSPDAYVAAYNAGELPSGAGTWQSAGGTIYVLGQAMTGGTNVVVTSPHTMTLAERTLNAAFVAGDQAAGAIGLPSLASIQKSLTVTLAYVVGAAVLFAIITSRRRNA